MKKIFITTILGITAVGGFSFGQGIDGVIKTTPKSARNVTRLVNSDVHELETMQDGAIKIAPKPARDGTCLVKYDLLTFDTIGVVVECSATAGVVTGDTKIVMGSFNEQRKAWEVGAPVPGGVNADIFKEAATRVIQIRITPTEDRKPIRQIMIKKIGGELIMTGPDFDGVVTDVFGEVIVYAPTELDEKGNIMRMFSRKVKSVANITKVAWGKYNDPGKKWEVGELIEGGLNNEMFTDTRGQTIYTRFVKENDGRGRMQILVRKIGGPLKE